MSTPPAKAPLAPLAGALNVTVAPDTGLPKASFTTAASRWAKAVFTVAVCGVPLAVDMEAAPPAWLVSAKPWLVVSVPAVAVTV